MEESLELDDELDDESVEGLRFRFLGRCDSRDGWEGGRLAVEGARFRLGGR